MNAGEKCCLPKTVSGVEKMNGIYGDLGRQEEGGVKSDLEVSALFLSTDPHLFVLLNVKYVRTEILFCFVLFFCVLFYFILFIVLAA